MNKINFSDLLAIWWTFFWRCLILSFVSYLTIGFLSAFVAALLEYSPETQKIVLVLSTTILSYFISIKALKQALNKKYKNFTIEIKRPNP